MGHEPAGKKKWEKPELVVLVRGRPEEGVLATCKEGYVAGSGSGSYSTHGKCLDACSACNATAPS